MEWNRTSQCSCSFCRVHEQNGVRCSLSQQRFTCLELASTSSWPTARNSGGQTEYGMEKGGRSDDGCPKQTFMNKSFLTTHPPKKQKRAGKKV